MRPVPDDRRWPELRYAAWQDTCATLHLWTQIVGKIRLAQTPWLNHSWHVPLYVNARGLTTSPIPYEGRAFQIDFDFIDHVLWIRTSDGHVRQLMLAPKSVAEFYADLFVVLGANLVRVGVTREASQAIPISGGFIGNADDPIGMHVDVSVGAVPI